MNPISCLVGNCNELAVPLDFRVYRVVHQSDCTQTIKPTLIRMCLIHTYFDGYLPAFSLICYLINMLPSFYWGMKNLALKGHWTGKIWVNSRFNKSIPAQYLKLKIATQKQKKEGRKRQILKVVQSLLCTLTGQQELSN